MAKQKTEERLALLEREVAELKLRLNQLSAPKANWIEKVCGSMKDYPEFDEVVKYGAEIRRADRPTDEPE